MPCEELADGKRPGLAAPRARTRTLDNAAMERREAPYAPVGYTHLLQGYAAWRSVSLGLSEGSKKDGGLPGADKEYGR